MTHILAGPNFDEALNGFFFVRHRYRECAFPNLLVAGMSTGITPARHHPTSERAASPFSSLAPSAGCSGAPSPRVGIGFSDAAQRRNARADNGVLQSVRWNQRHKVDWRRRLWRSPW
jgi:hypothetical protein